MLPLERKNKIMDIVKTHGIISFNDLMHLLDVSHMTIRRDVKDLEEQGKVVIVHGGVRISEGVSIEDQDFINSKSLYNSFEKKSIGGFAASLIPLKSTVFLDAGSTTYEIALKLLERDDLTIVTNCLFISNLLCIRSSCKVIQIGGVVDKANRSCVGDIASYNMDKFNFSVSFISTSYWNYKEISTPDESKVSFKKKIKDRSDKVYLACDSSKYGKSSSFKVIALSDFEGVITDSGLSDDKMKLVEGVGVKLYLV